MAEVGRPPGLAVGHQLVQVRDQRIQVERPEGLGIVEVGAQRIGPGGVLVQCFQVEGLRPPLPVGMAACAMHYGASTGLCLGIHSRDPLQYRIILNKIGEGVKLDWNYSQLM